MKIVTANRLRDGVAVYYAGHDWSEHVLDARVAEGADDESLLLASARRDEAHNHVVSAYLIAVEEVSGQLLPIDKKERVRAVGPSVRPDLNRPLAGA